MTARDEETKAHEVVIIRQRANGEEAPHKGGVWKIAYADFMTAMMAFFLVMWLINAADKRVITQVANYFNPLRLTDRSPAQRGVHDMESGEQGKQQSPGKAKEIEGTPKSESKAAPGKPKFTEQALFSDPYGVLARLAAEAQDDRQATAAKSEGVSKSGAEAYRDPFDPASRREAPMRPRADAKGEQQPQKSATPSPSAPSEKPESPVASEAGASIQKGTESAGAAPGAVAAGTESAGPSEATKAPGSATAQGSETGGPAEAVKAPGAGPAQGPERVGLVEAPQVTGPAAAPPPPAAPAAQPGPSRPTAQQDAARLESEIKRTLASVAPGTLPNIDVTVAEDGLLITLTDGFDFGMFAIASAEPRPATVLVMEKIAKLLQTHPQRLIVRGHTDGRPYRSGSYDNWRLSTARAHMAYYMLVRGGVEEKRFDRVEGHADRSLRVPSDPDAAQNRRIEILLRKAKP